MRRDRLLLLAFFLSGAAALGYEILWTRLLSLALGSETLGFLGTLAGFFGGLAIGSFALHARARRSADPARLFAVFETTAALYALASPWLLHALARRLPPLLGPAAGDNNTPLALLLSLGTSTLVLLPATIPMGATLAALVEARRRALAEAAEGTGLGRLYGANTFGATAGVLLSVHLLLPQLGMAAGAGALAALGITSASLALLWRRGLAPRPHEAPSGEDGAESRVHGKGFRSREIYLLLFGTGLAGVGLEVAGVQVLAQPLEDTLYTFSHILAVYLLGTAAGAWIFSHLAERISRRGAREVAAGLLAAHALSVMVAAVVLRLSPHLLDAFAPDDAGLTARMVAELVLAALVFLGPTLLMGALASHLLAQIAGRGVGRAYGCNTLGATLAPFVFGLLGIPLLGYAGAVYLAGWLYLGLFALVAVGQGWKRSWTWGPVGAMLVAQILAPWHLVLVEVPEGWRELATRQTLMGLVRVTELIGSDQPGARLQRRLQVNQEFRMGGGVAFGERRMGHIPLLLAPEAKSALFLGSSTGGTLGPVRYYPLERIDAVELVPDIVGLMPLFDYLNERVGQDPRVRLHTADARRFVAASRDRYGVVVADLFHPAKDGAGTLYSREHFEEVREHLAPGGLFAQWLPLYQFDEKNLKTVVRTFLAVFPEVHSFLGIYNPETPALVLLGKADGKLKIDLDRLQNRLRKPVYQEVLMQDARDFLGAYMLDREALARYAGEGPLNTDLNPRVLFDAPESAYANRRDLAYGSLLSLLPRRTLYPEELVTSRQAAHPASFRRDAARFSRALGHYLQGEVARYAAGEDALVPAEARERYLRAYEAAPEFRPAADLLVALSLMEPEHSEAIYRRMLARTPEQAGLYRAWLGALEETGDRGRYAAVLEEARSRFGAESFPAPRAGA